MKVFAGAALRALTPGRGRGQARAALVADVAGRMAIGRVAPAGDAASRRAGTGRTGGALMRVGRRHGVRR